MFDWLFGDGRKKKRDRALKKKEAPTARFLPNDPQSPQPRTNTDQVAAKLGGPENIAKMVKSMLAEDRMKK